jgi:SAM-dependent methyltransferase
MTAETGLRDFAKRWIVPFFDPRALARVSALPRYFAQMRAFRRMAGPQSVRLRDSYPCLSDRTATTAFDPHYFYQSAWLARRLAAIRPRVHVDVGSSVMMIGDLSAFVPTVFVDIRPLEARLTGLHSVAGSIAALPFATGSQMSVSCLHVIEHIGLGRYGDPLDADGARKALLELQRIVAPDGRLYLSTPVGRERVCFNAHRVFSPETIVAGLAGMRLAAFSLVDDAGRFIPHCEPHVAARMSYACGIFEFIKQP